MSELSLIKVTKAEPIGGYRLRLSFSDGSVGERDFADVVHGSGAMLEPLRDPAYFARIFIDVGTPTWPNGYDLAPNALYTEMSKAKLLRQAATA
jgi:hypothetical protein